MATVIVAAWASASVFVIWWGLATAFLRRRDQAWQVRLQQQAMEAQAQAAQRA